MEQMKEKQGVTEQLKAENQMLWVFIVELKYQLLQRAIPKVA